MRGLLINNYYAVRANAKVFSGFMLLLGLFAAAVISQSLGCYMVFPLTEIRIFFFCLPQELESVS